MEDMISKVSVMGKFITGHPVEVKTVASMTPLTKRNYGSFMTPIKDSV